MGWFSHQLEINILNSFCFSKTKVTCGYFCALNCSFLLNFVLNFGYLYCYIKREVSHKERCFLIIVDAGAFRPSFNRACHFAAGIFVNSVGVVKLEVILASS